MSLLAFQAYSSPPFLTLPTVPEVIVSADLSSSHLSLLQHRLSRGSRVSSAQCTSFPGLLTGLFLTLILLIPGSILDFQALFIPRHLPMVGWPDCTLWWGNWSLLEQLCLAQSSYASPLTALWQSVLLRQHMNLVHSLKSIFAFLG